MPSFPPAFQARRRQRQRQSRTKVKWKIFITDYIAIFFLRHRSFCFFCETVDWRLETWDNFIETRLKSALNRNESVNIINIVVVVVAVAVVEWIIESRADWKCCKVFEQLRRVDEKAEGQSRSNMAWKSIERAAAAAEISSTSCA